MKNEASSSGSSSRSRGESVVVDVGRRRSSCGYCKSGRRTSVSHGLWAHSLTVNDYQDLLDRGWRRSGCFVYKPEMETTCCPAYTIRLNADDFVPSKEQLRVSRRMHRYLDGTLDARKHEELVHKPGSSQGSTNAKLTSSETNSLAFNGEEKNKEEEFVNYLHEQINNAVQSCIKNGDLPCGVQLPRDFIKKVSQIKRKRLGEGSEDLLYTSNASFQIAASLRRTKTAENDSCDLGSPKSDAVGSPTSLELPTKLIAEKLASSCQQLVEIPDLSVRACNGHINFYSATKQNSLDNERSSATLPNKTFTHHESEPYDKTFEQSQVKKRKLEIRLKRSSFDPEEFALYRKYQLKVHNDTPDHVTESSYMRFLVDTPLIYVPPAGDGAIPPCGFGSFHQQYVVDGHLIAVGVIDILPKCLSSKYLFWDPDLAFLSLGKYSALQEIDWVNDNKHFCPSLQYYYLGYYIHSCSKMTYKAAYNPSELLCPVHYKWVPFSIAKPLLDRKKYAALSDFSSSLDVELLLQKEQEDLMELQQDDLGHGDLNDIRVNENEETVNPHSESSDDESFPEASDHRPTETRDADVSNVLIGLKGSCVRYKDLQQVLDPVGRSYLENQLSQYTKVVGSELSERMVYTLT
ncbi:hypothetical protein Ancab_005951 [Ancistrocladus abbreviatus]